MKKTKYPGIYEDTPTKDGRKYIYMVWIKDINGNNKQKKSEHYLTAKEAYAEKTLIQLKKKAKHKVDFKYIAMDYFKYLEKTRKPKTVYNYKCDYKNYIEPYFGNEDINEVNSIFFIRKWAEEIEKKGFSLAYNNKIYNILNNIMNHAVKYHGLENNYVQIFGRFQRKNDEVIKDDEKIRYITYNEFNKFIKCVDNYVYKCFFYFTYYTGCRKGEIFALTWEEINFDTKEISICKTLDPHTKDKNGNILITNTKTKENRRIVMNNTLYDIMFEYKKNMMKYADFDKKWFVFGSTVHFSGTNVDRIKDKAFEKSGVHRITMHEFRHSHVTLCINEYLKKCKEKDMKIDMYQFLTRLSKRMGHTIEVMLETYSHLFPTIQDEIVDLLDNI